MRKRATVWPRQRLKSSKRKRQPQQNPCFCSRNDFTRSGDGFLGADRLVSALHPRRDRGPELPPTGSPEAVARLQSPQTSFAAAGAGFVTLAATLSSIHAVPVAGLVLLLGVDRFMNEARAVTNLIGNAVATIAVAKWDGAFI